MVLGLRQGRNLRAYLRVVDAKDGEILNGGGAAIRVGNVGVKRAVSHGNRRVHGCVEGAPV